MNAFMGENGHGPVAPGWRQFLKLSEVGAPSSTVVMVDEHPNSIDDGWFVDDPGKTNVWVDLPASQHAGCAGMSFVDGHSEIHKWVDAGTRQSTKTNGPKPYVTVPAGTAGRDLAWMLQRLTQVETNGAENSKH